MSSQIEEIGIRLRADGVVETTTGVRVTAQSLTELADKADKARKPLDNLGVSAGQTKAAMRQLPAQITDIVTSLAGGQSAFTVAIQQGGQIKDSFGGIVPAGRALLGLLTPLTLAVGGVGASVSVLGLAYFQGRREQDVFARSVVLTGYAAGKTVGQMADMARGIGAVTGTQAAAAEALGLMADSAMVAGANLQKFSEIALRMEQVAGQSVQQTVNTFAELGRSPVQAAVKLNESTNFLTVALYKQVKALQENGRLAEAGSLAQNAYADAMKARSDELKARLGYLESAWLGITKAAKGGWDAMLGLGREQTLNEKISDVVEQIRKAEQRLADARNSGVKVAGLGIEQRELDLLKTRLGYLREEQRMETGGAERKAAEAAATREKIANLDSGRADAFANASIDLKLANARNASAQEIALLEIEQQQKAAAFALGLSTASAYEAEKIDIVRREVDARSRLIDIEIELENKRPTNGPASVEAQKGKVAALVGAQAAAVADGGKKILQTQNDADSKLLEGARLHAQQWADAWLQAHNTVQALARSNADAAMLLIQDPNAQATVQAAAKIKRLREDADRTTLPWRVAVATTADQEQRAALQQQIVDMYEGTESAVVLINAKLTQDLKPEWQRMLEGWQDTTRLMRESSDSLFSTFLRSGEDAFVQLMTTGSINIRSLMNTVVAEMARAQFRQWAGNNAGGIGGLFGGLFGSFNAFGGIKSGGFGTGAGFGNLDLGQFFHAGGTRGEATFTRSLPASTWHGAPKFHTGIGPGELPAIIKSDEGVFTKGQMRAMAPVDAVAKAAGPRINFAPNIHIDARADRGEVYGLVINAVRQGQAELLDAMARGMA